MAGPTDAQVRETIKYIDPTYSGSGGHPQFGVVKAALEAGFSLNAIKQLYDAGGNALSIAVVQQQGNVKTQKDAEKANEVKKSLGIPTSTSVDAASRPPGSSSSTNPNGRTDIQDLGYEAWRADNDVAQAPDAVVRAIANLMERDDISFFDYDPKNGIVTFLDENRRQVTFKSDGGGLYPLDIYKAGQAGTVTAEDVARTNVLNLQAEQLNALLKGELIDLGNGKSLIKGTTTLISNGTPGQLKPVDGMPNMFYDPASGNFVDNNSNILAKDTLEFNKKKHDTEMIEARATRQQTADLTREGLAWDSSKHSDNLSETQRGTNLSAMTSALGVDTNAQGRKLSDVVSGANTYQSTLDDRSKSLVALKADPGNFVASEYMSRGLANPTPGSEYDLFKDVPISQYIDELRAWQPNTAGAVRGEINANPGKPASAYIAPPVVKPPPVVPLTSSTGMQGPVTSPPPAAPTTPPIGQGVDTGLNQTSDALKAWADNYNKTQYIPGGGGVERLAQGGISSEFISGDSTHPTDPGAGGAKPEHVEVMDPAGANNAFAQVTPLETPGVGPEGSEAGTPISRLLRAVADVVDESGSMAPPPMEGIARHAYGTPNTSMTTNTDASIQGLPSLSYLLGGNKQAYESTNTKPYQGAFGTQLPSGAALNYGRALDVAEDPIQAGLMSSLYRSASRDFGGEIAQAKRRAPIGNAGVSSMVKY